MCKASICVRYILSVYDLTERMFKEASLKVGIIGYEGSGKTTIFGALSGVDPEELVQLRQQIREVRVPDSRIDALSEMYHPKKTIYATIQFVDVMSGAAVGKGLDSSVLGKIREVDLLAICVRGFDNGYSKPEPKREAQAMLSELLLSDMEIVERKVTRMQKEKVSDQEKALFLKLQSALEAETWLKDLNLDKNELDMLRGYQLMTLKPALVIVNVDESQVDEKSAAEVVSQLGLSCPSFVLSARVESEIAQLPEADQAEFLKDLGITATARERFIRESYRMLDLISFFTVGEDEVRAWTVRKGSTAQESAGKIHTDLAKHFIRAEKMTSADLLALGSEAAVKEAGKFKLEGKGYITEDGDILHIRANV